MSQLHRREKSALPLDRHGNPILPAKKEEVAVKAKAPAKKKAASKKKVKK